MEVIEEQTAFATLHGLFKAGNAWDVVLKLNCPSVRISQQRVSHVDFFISHCWSTPSWRKSLAICHYLNLDLAIFLSVAACLSALAALTLYAGSLEAIAKTCQPWLKAAFLYWPMLVFVWTFLFGHVLRSSTFWMDHFCINEQNLFEKAQALQALPAFVAHSQQILALWDSRYFERLWCIYELAISAKTDTSQLKLVPVWAPVFTLSAMAVTFFFACSYNAEPPRNQSSPSEIFASWFQYAFFPAPLIFLASLPVSWFCIEKLDSHALMLEQMASFDLCHAECTLETDRVVIERQVRRLFDEAFEAPIAVSLDAPEDAWTSSADPLMSQETMSSIRHITSYPNQEQIIQEFNAYVRGPVRDRVLNSMGRETHISFKICAAYTLPVWFQGVVLTVGCDGHDCQQAAPDLGYLSLPCYVVTNAVNNFLIGPLSYTLIFPLALRGHSWISRMSKLPRMLCGSIISAFALLVTDAMQALGIGSAAVVVNKFSMVWLASFMSGLSFTCILAWLLFRSTSHSRSRRPLVLGS